MIIVIAACAQRLINVYGSFSAEYREENSDIIVQTIEEIDDYLAARRQQFTLPLALRSPFQHKVWNYLQTIPYGETRTYTEMAEHIGHANAVRAVGSANGANAMSSSFPATELLNPMVA